MTGQHSTVKLRELRLADFVDKDELLMAYERALVSCENEKEQMKMEIEQMKKDKEKESQRANETETPEHPPMEERVKAPVVNETSEDMLKSNRLQIITLNAHFLITFSMRLTDKKQMTL